MNPPAPEPADQRLVGTVLLVLVALGLAALLVDLARRPAGSSRIDWPQTAPARKP